MASASPSEAGTDPLLPAACRVLARRQELADTWTLELEPPGGRLPFRPGQFTMLYAFGVGEVPISISGDPARPELLVHTVRAVGAVSRALCALEPGQALGVRGPYGAPWPVEDARGGDLLVVAGGLGLAPLRPAVLQALHERERFGRVTLLYGGRTPPELLFREQLEGWARDPRLEVQVTVDAADPSWGGHVGVVPALLRRQALDPARTTALVCGPEVMMRFTAQALLQRGVAPERLFVSLERNMKCAVGTCGHCQLGREFVCKDGPVLPWSRLARLLSIREL